MSGKDCSAFKKDKCKGLKCQSYKDGTCTIQFGTAPPGNKPTDYDRGDF